LGRVDDDARPPYGSGVEQSDQAEEVVAEDRLELTSGTPRRRLGNFRTPELAARVREVLAEAGIPSSCRPDPERPERWGRWLDWLVHMTGAKGNRVWVPRARFREAVRTLNEARRRGD
jgi:hypothetical protein